MPTDAFYIAKAFPALATHMQRNGRTAEIPNWNRLKSTITGQMGLPPEQSYLSNAIYRIWLELHKYYQEAEYTFFRPDILHAGSHDNPDMLCITGHEATAYKLWFLKNKHYQNPHTWEAFEAYANTHPSRRPDMPYGTVPEKLLKSMKDLKLARAVKVVVVLSQTGRVMRIQPRTLLVLEPDADC